MKQIVTRFYEDNQLVMLIGAVLVLIVSGIVINRIITDVRHHQCITSVLNSSQNKLAFGKYEPETDNAIFITTADGVPECRISKWGDSTYDVLPAWSPDGRRIAFVSGYFQANHILYGVFVMNTDGADRRMITGGEPGFIYGKPTWSPDSQSLAFSKIFSDKSSQIYVVSTEATKQARLVVVSGIGDNYAAWSPDGKQILFEMRKATSSFSDIYVVDIDGSNARRLTQNGGVTPAWSPNGQQIAFASSYNVLNLDLFIMDADGTNIHRLITDGSAISRYLPAWSPDGRQIAFNSGSSISVVNVDGSELPRFEKAEESRIFGPVSWNGLLVSPP